MSFLTRLILFLIGLPIMSFGVVFVIKCNLGSSPISSIPFVVEQLTPYTLGELTFAINAWLVAMQYFFTRRITSPLLLQVPMTLLFSIYIDLSAIVLENFFVDTYLMSLTLLVTACFVTAFGIAFLVIANLVILPGEGAVQAIANRFGLDFGFTKIGFDVSCVLISIAIALYCRGDLAGLREGTIISAFLTGWFVRFWLRRITTKDSYGRMILALPFTKNRPSSIIKE
ncbi:MAG: hypothetical protein IJN28_01885 [Selenomonadales bacterium]|nr:hypothetical protein [Selenomonadales bacterium]